MGTHVVYNDVHLYNCLTRQWDEEMVYDGKRQRIDSALHNPIPMPGEDANQHDEQGG